MKIPIYAMSSQVHTDMNIVLQEKTNKQTKRNKEIQQYLRSMGTDLR